MASLQGNVCDGLHDHSTCFGENKVDTYVVCRIQQYFRSAFGKKWEDGATEAAEKKDINQAWLDNSATNCLTTSAPT